MKEIWKDVIGYEGLYQVSNLGRVKSLARNHSNCQKGRILKPLKIWCGYLQVHLSKSGKRKCFLVHRLVAIHFIPNPKNKPQVNHEDGNKENCCVSNLTWVTNGENQKHAFKNGLQTRQTGKSNPKAKKINQYDKQGNLIKTWECMIDIEKELNISHSFISHCCKGKQKTAKGYIWRYYEEENDVYKN